MQFVGDTISEYLAKVRKCLSDNHGFSKVEIDSALEVTHFHAYFQKNISTVLNKSPEFWAAQIICRYSAGISFYLQ